MRVSIDWLKDYVTVSADAHEVAERLTMSLNEVDEVQTLKGLASIVVGEIVEITPHPDADSMVLTKVRVGKKQVAIVCGATNISAGDKVPVALPGVTLPSGLTIAKRQIRGVASEGMLCSAKELAFGDDHSGIWLLPAGAEVGKRLPKALRDTHDTFELEVLANRPDCMGHVGIAREVAAAFRVKLHEPKLKTPGRSKPGAYTVKLARDSGCSRYALAHLTGLTNRPSPDWLQHRLSRVGIRPISAVVDVTNFVMLEYAQPLHAVDADSLRTKTITVRGATPRETLTTLDGKQRQLPAGITVITEAKQLIGIGGIMGGASTEVSKNTANIVLESAHFDPATIRRSSRALGLRTDASARFERGIAESLTAVALRRAVDLLLKICGGKLEQFSDTYPQPLTPAKVTFDHSAMNDFLGTDIAVPEARSLLRRYGFAVSQGKPLKVTVPTWRTDVALPVDLYEEVARGYGYENIPTTLPASVAAVPTTPPLHGLVGRLRDQLVALGLTEIQTHSLVGLPLLEKAGHDGSSLVELANPLSEDHRFMRDGMPPRHFQAIQDNLRWRDSVEFFEIGKVFRPQGKRLPKESMRLTITVGTVSKADRLADLRGILEQLTLALQLPRLSFVSAPSEAYIPGRSFAISASGKRFGYLAEFSRAVRFKAGRIFVLEISLDDLALLIREDRTIRQPSPYPAVTRDLSLLMPPGKTYAKLSELIGLNGGPLLHAQRLLEEYRDDQRRSLTIRLEYSHTGRTLTDQEVHQAVKELTSAVSRAGYTLRG